MSWIGSAIAKGIDAARRDRSHGHKADTQGKERCAIAQHVDAVCRESGTRASPQQRAERLICAGLDDSYSSDCVGLRSRPSRKPSVMALRVPRAVPSILYSPLLLALAGPLLPAGMSTAHAKKKAPPTPTEEAPAGLSLEEIAVMLSSANADEVKMAIESSALLGKPDVVPMLSERVRAGLPPDLLNSALDSLSVINQPSASELFVALTRHRRASVRVRSVQALVALRTKNAEPALVIALGDSAPEVREAAAEGLGQLSATGSVEPLFQAFDRGVVSSARALGKLVRDDQVPRLLEFIGRMPLTSLTPVFDASTEPPRHLRGHQAEHRHRARRAGHRRSARLPRGPQNQATRRASALAQGH